MNWIQVLSSPLPLLSLSVEPPKGSLTVEPLTDLMVEHLKVLSLTVEPAYASLSVEHLKVLSLTVEPAYASLSVDPSSRGEGEDNLENPRQAKMAKLVGF
jgi:hypothetical protein